MDARGWIEKQTARANTPVLRWGLKDLGPCRARPAARVMGTPAARLVLGVLLATGARIRPNSGVPAGIAFTDEDPRPYIVPQPRGASVFSVAIVEPLLGCSFFVSFFAEGASATCLETAVNPTRRVI